MLDDHKKRDIKHLINLISKRSNHTPNFSFLIGAGASSSSGIKTAGQMIDGWRRQLYEQSESNEPIEEWLIKQNWYEDDEEYSILFEKVCDQRSQRRICIEDCVKDATPSWGYIYLANIIAHQYCNIAFTPNFDDLINEACFLYTDLRPIMCAHDSAVVDIRVTSARPKIIKLHGDFLYDSMKNTVRETETLEKNMRDKFMQFAREYGLVVIGYGGNDRSIMDTLDILLRSDSYFPNGLYWCVKDEGKVSKKLDRLMRRDNVYWVKIDGFDEFMSELHEELGIPLPDAVRDPYKATTERLNRFILPEALVTNDIIKDDIKELEEQVKIFERIISGEARGEEYDKFVPYKFIGDREYSRHEYENALNYYEKALIQNPDEIYIMGKVVESFIPLEQFSDADKMAEKMIKQHPKNYLGYLCKGLTLNHVNKSEDAIKVYIEALKYAGDKATEQKSTLTSKSNSLLIIGKWGEALSDAEKALEIAPNSQAALINKCIALKKLNRKEEAYKIIEDALPNFKAKYISACAFACLGNKDNMLKELERAIYEDRKNRVQAKIDPDFADYREDPDFKKLVYETNPQDDET